MSAVAPGRVLVVDESDEVAMSLAILLKHIDKLLKHLDHEAAVADGGAAVFSLAALFWRAADELCGRLKQQYCRMSPR